MSDLKITRMTKGEWGKIRAFFDVEIVEGITVSGFKLIQGEQGQGNHLFVGVPSVKKKDDSYDQIISLDKMQYITLNKVANEYYENGADSKEKEPIPF
tara:strand:- start:302 stop:595 length:294 start_codon:yes stop_codon:yes gene_type:complete